MKIKYYFYVIFNNITEGLYGYVCILDKGFENWRIFYLELDFF